MADSERSAAASIETMVDQLEKIHEVTDKLINLFEKHPTGFETDLQELYQMREEQLRLVDTALEDLEAQRDAMKFPGIMASVTEVRFCGGLLEKHVSAVQETCEMVDDFQDLSRHIDTAIEDLKALSDDTSRGR